MRAPPTYRSPLRSNNHEQRTNINEEDTYLQEDDTDICESQIQQLSHYVDALSKESSIFNNSLTQTKMLNQVTCNSSIISIRSSTYSRDLLSTYPLELQLNNGCEMDSMDTHNVFQTNNLPIRSIVTVRTKALDSDGVNLELNVDQHENRISSSNETIQYIDRAICSMNQFALQNNLDKKQTIAFQTVCASFMMSFLMDTSIDISPSEREHCLYLLQEKGGCQQLLMCVTGPGGSGKSHIIKCCRLYCKMFCDAIGKPFNFSVFPVTATSNAAAALVQGFTIHSAALLNSNYVQNGIIIRCRLDNDKSSYN